jgi:hypothetical protein
MDRLLQPEYTLLAKQWQAAKKSADEEHFFAYLDFQKGPEVFQRVRLPFLPHLFRQALMLALGDDSSACRPLQSSSYSCRPRGRERRASWPQRRSTLAGRALYPASPVACEHQV